MTLFTDPHSTSVDTLLVNQVGALCREVIPFQVLDVAGLSGGLKDRMFPGSSSFCLSAKDLEAKLSPLFSMLTETESTICSRDLRLAACLTKIRDHLDDLLTEDCERARSLWSAISKFTPNLFREPTGDTADAYKYRLEFENYKTTLNTEITRRQKKVLITLGSRITCVAPSVESGSEQCQSAQCRTTLGLLFDVDLALVPILRRARDYAALPVTEVSGDPARRTLPFAAIKTVKLGSADRAGSAVELQLDYTLDTSAEAGRGNDFTPVRPVSGQATARFMNTDSPLTFLSWIRTLQPEIVSSDDVGLSERFIFTPKTGIALEEVFVQSGKPLNLYWDAA
jgi:hypothetical protein